MTINYNEKIPNNVDLSSDRRLKRALENWQPKFLDWWEELGPNQSSELDVYLRTAVSVENRDGHILIMLKCLNIDGVFFLLHQTPTGKLILVCIKESLSGKRSLVNIVQS